MGTRATLCGCLLALLVVPELSAQDNPIPRRTFSVAASYPPEGDGVHIISVLEVELVATLDDQGRVAEIRKVKEPITPPPTGVFPPAARAASDAFTREAAAALRQWTFDPPARTPTSFFATFSFKPRSEVTATYYATPPPRTVRVGVGKGSPLAKRVEPVYPAAAQQARVQGTVIVEITVGVDGKVTDARVLRGIPLLDQAALDAVRQWEYTPAVLAGTLTSSIVTAGVTFTLPPPDYSR